MTPAEETIEIDAASEGMVLAQDLRDAGGGVLLPAGATLSASSLASLRRRGIERVQVVAAEAPVDEAAVRAERERQCARLARLFRRCLTGSPANASAVLYERLLAYRGGC
ncbi:hypothetical protein F2P44_18400 [Massilia sp. CCM 8695]|uniref:Uncharacterized protein n=1 Tax=Massilia frigida TaxID=2609281 RepID=A0ABX0NGS9_9BURK|nr:hypothetical protein [Massilia frigida]NHZ81230.1 hypothetical protein [Massilia frigida]